MLIIFQILFSFFGLFAIISVFQKKKENKLGPKATIFWILFWLASIVIVLWPESASKIASYLGIGRGADMIIYISVAVIFYLLFKLNVKLDSLNRDVTKVIRNKALGQNQNNTKR
ncbi:MAG: DUF2304 family protein [Patescibacteria group bacterium]